MAKQRSSNILVLKRHYKCDIHIITPQHTDESVEILNR